MVLACSKSIGGGLVDDEFDILERFISTEKMAKKAKQKRMKTRDKEASKQLENYAKEN